MSYAALAAKTTSRKIVLVEFDLGKLFTQFVSEGPGIWKGGLFYRAEIDHSYESGAFLVQPYATGGTAELVTNPEYTQYSDVGSVQEDGVPLTEYSAYADMYTNAGSWYFDRDDQLLYVHMTNSDWIHEHTMVVGMVYKITNDSLANDLRQGQFEERLTGVPTLSKTKDSQTYGLIQHAGGSVEFNNEDGGLDQIMGMDYFGQPLVERFGFEGLSYSEYITLTRGYIESAEFGWKKLRFNLRDDRAKLSRKVPIRTFDQTTYPYLHDDDIGKPIPIFYGEVRNAPALCVNRTQGGSPAWTFKVCDVADHSYGIEDITTVYVDGTAVTPTATDEANGTFTVANGDWDGKKKVTFDGKGLHDSTDTYIENLLDVITDLMSVYLLVAYNSTNYETMEWAASKAHSLANNGGIWLDDETEIIEIIEGACRSTGGNFIKLDNGRYTFRFTDIEKAIRGTIRLQEFMEPTTLMPDSDSLVSVVRVGWKPNLEEREFRWSVANSRRSSIFARYSKDNDIELETYLTSEADAEELAAHLYDLYDDAEPVVEVTVKSQYMDVEIMDVYQVELLRANGNRIIPDFVGEMIGIEKNPLDALVTMRIRRLRDVGTGGAIQIGVFDEMGVTGNVSGGVS